MPLLADLHIHSRYAYATSQSLSLPSLHRAAREKGLGLLGTGDFTHPAWWEALQSDLEPAQEGLFRLRPALAQGVDHDLPAACAQETPRFVLQVEVSTLFRRADRLHKMHSLVFMPSLEAADGFRQRLGKYANLAADGRPTVKLDVKELLELTLECAPGAFLVPAHIWTPWFSLLGSRSGFDSLAEAFGPLAGEIFAAETGLSSDPAMNWRVRGLDGLTLISCSDAHSSANLGREACLLDGLDSYEGLYRTLKSREGFLGTLEFHPEEGKYHHDGHRACGLRLRPEETRALGGRCPQCGGLLTVGVLSRVGALADRPEGEKPDSATGFETLVPLEEVLAESLGSGKGSQKVQRLRSRLLETLGPELQVLREVPLEEVKREGGERVAEAIQRVRTGNLSVSPGYDGTYGTVRIFPESGP